ncbi:MAG: flagellar biosynthesis anti-sigma factor FlgM [Nitrospirae bacterium]|nr:flagellar biosynthesis anti-sigma factor FlgM [Nitrospirota bacterium]MDA8215140.1 flagellar biosynthesis anti-sigma factor FlgM [Nitrospiraceae bacterium]
MRITDKIEVVGSNLQKPDRAKEKAGERSEEVLSKDQVTVSEKAKEIGRLQIEVSKLPEIRTDRVDEIKNAINAGTYNVKGEAVAGKLLEEAIIDSII